MRAVSYSIIGHVRYWQKRRSAFNHDWMKNQYLQALDDWINLLDDKQEDKELERTFISEKLPLWEENRGDIIWLYETFEVEMSPRVLFDEPFLVNADSNTKEWLGNLIHVIWLERYGIKAILDRLFVAIQGVDIAYGRLRDALKAVPDTMSIGSLRPLRSLFADFRSACGAVASAVEKFPSEVLVP